MSDAIQTDIISIILFVFQHPTPIYAKLMHYKVLTVAVTSPHDVYNAFCPYSTLALRQGCSLFLLSRKPETYYGETFLSWRIFIPGHFAYFAFDARGKE